MLLYRCYIQNTMKGLYMKLTKSIQDSINEQINFELSSAYLYLSMSAHFEAKTLPGLARWMSVQAEEETGHAMKFFKYVFERGGEVVLKGISLPQTKFKGPLEIFTQVLAHEQKVTAAISKIYELAQREKDYPTQSFLQWFIDEQVEEEKNAADIIALLERTGSSPLNLLLADRQLGTRKKD
jgi:ferritin